MHWPVALALTAVTASVLLGGSGTPTAATPPLPARGATPMGVGRVIARVPVAEATGVVGPVAPSSAWTWPTAAPQVVLRAFDPPTSRWGSGHRGVDLATAVGDPIRAPADGHVAFSGMVAGRPVLVIAHPGGLRSTLEPVSGLVPVGASVRRSEGVGQLTGHSGHCVPATCLHWGVLRGEVYLDPLALIAGRVVLLPTM